MMNKSAREMFEELGYELTIYANNFIAYRNNTKEILFDLHYKNFKCSSDFHYNRSVEVSLKELQAINKQVEELWGNQNGNMEEN